MFFRLMVFLCAQLAGGLLGGWQGGPWGAAAGVAVAAWAWFFWDLARGLRVLHWLRHGELAQAPRLHGLWGEICDRTRRLLRQQQGQVQDSNQRLQEVLAALQASPNGVILLSADGCIEWCNQIAAAHFGIDAERDLLQSIGNLVRHPDFSAYLASRDHGADVLLDGRHSTPAHPVRLSVQLHRYGAGRGLLLSRDVTALEQAEAMRRDFVANVSHEIRTPLTVLGGFVETLQTLPLAPEEQARYLALMAQQAARMQSLVQDLLTLSRLEGSPLPGLGDWTPVAQLLTACEDEARALSALLAPAPQQVHVLRFPSQEALAALGEVAGVQTELQSALSNLVGNAVRHTPAPGVIRVTWEFLPDGSAVFAVADTGPGIDPVHLPRLTERFYRIDRSRSRATGGTGLGLAIVKHVLQRHGATLHIQSVPGRGATFSLHLPAQRLRASPPAPALMGGPVSAAAPVAQ